MNRLVFLDAGQSGIDKDASAVFAHDDLFPHLDLGLLLRRDTVEAAAAGVTLDVDHSETVACVLADALECVEQTLVVKLLFEFLGVVAQVFLVLTGLVDDFVKLVALFGKNVL